MMEGKEKNYKSMAIANSTVLSYMQLVEALTWSFNVRVWCTNTAFSFFAVTVVRQNWSRRVSPFAVCGVVGGINGVTGGIRVVVWRDMCSWVADILGTWSGVQYVTDHEGGMRWLWSSRLGRFWAGGTGNSGREFGWLCISDALPGRRRRRLRLVSAAGRLLSRRTAGGVLLFLSFLLRVHDCSWCQTKTKVPQLMIRVENHRLGWSEVSVPQKVQVFSSPAVVFSEFMRKRSSYSVTG